MSTGSRACFGTVGAEPMFTDLLPAARAWQPDLLVAEQAEFAGPLVAAVLGVPNVCHGFGSIKGATKVANTGERVAHLWLEQGLEPKPYGGCYEHLYINIYPPNLQPESTAHVGLIQDLGPGNAATSGDEHLPDWVTADVGTPLVYVTFGTVFRNDSVLVAIIEALREMPVRVVVTVGPQGDPAALGEQPDQVHVARYIPQAQLIPHCAAAVSHGGSGIFLAALMAGLPQLCVPQGADQFVNAAVCVRAGAGLAIEPEDVNTDALRAAADRLFNAGLDVTSIPPERLGARRPPPKTSGASVRERAANAIRGLSSKRRWGTHNNGAELRSTSGSRETPIGASGAPRIRRSGPSPSAALSQRSPLHFKPFAAEAGVLLRSHRGRLTT